MRNYLKLREITWNLFGNYLQLKFTWKCLEIIKKLWKISYKLLGITWNLFGNQLQFEPTIYLETCQKVIIRSWKYF